MICQQQREVSQDTYFQYANALFQKAFADELEVETVESITDLLETVGTASNGFQSYAEANAEDLIGSQDQLLESGILSAPAFVLEGEIFHGREHLPVITWMLGGRAGTPPV